ncbi:putative glycoside hydrolase [Rubellicoccus peritrichatus]|uniref:Glycoside hydrolase n=1 Tax=Rubellicoccus peritrichatus TaxID=3080537 RepID=A0AAQ3LAB8_9BACT|nr:putative glycoside hydrolase [Puniceicoccus sp. CR14]WOO40285.1 putative glycoside hydrolase [Puniceicoccus sp. CR14]
MKRIILLSISVLFCCATLQLNAELSAEHQEKLEAILEAHFTAIPFDRLNIEKLYHYARDNKIGKRDLKQLKGQWTMQNWKRIWQVRINSIEDTPLESSSDPLIASGKKLPPEFVENDMWIRFYTQNRMGFDEVKFSNDEMAVMNLISSLAYVGGLDELPEQLLPYSNNLPPTQRDLLIARASNWVITTMGPGVGYDKYPGSSVSVWEPLVHSKNPMYRCIALNGISDAIPKHLQHLYTPWPSEEKRSIRDLSAHQKYELYKLYFEEESEPILQALYSCLSNLPISEPLSFLKSEFDRRSNELSIKEIDQIEALQSKVYDPFAPAAAPSETIKISPKLYAIQRLSEKIPGGEARIKNIPNEYKERMRQSKQNASIHLKVSHNQKEPTAAERIDARDFPSIFQAWNPAENLKNESKLKTEARHDLIFHAPDFFGLLWDTKPYGKATGFTKDSLEAGKNRRDNLLELNPNMIILCEIRYRDAHRSFLEEDSDWWWRDDKGQPKVGWEEGDYLLLDFSNPDYRKHVAQRAKAAVDSGVFDGVFLDWWMEDEDRLLLLQEVRAAIGEDALILVNANDRHSPKSASYINGHFMECYRSQGKKDWKRIEDALVWAEAHLREPRINCLETWYAKSREDLSLMRATTTLGLTRSNGYLLFADPNPLPTSDHLHDWYSFWDADLGKPISQGEQRADGSVLREFTKGYAVYNPPGETTTVTFTTPHRRYSNDAIAQTHEIEPLDGDIFIAISEMTKQTNGSAH